MKKQVVFTMALLIALSAASQNPQRTYDRIEKSLYQQHYTTAYQAADSLRTWALGQVKKKGDDEALSRCLLTSTWYMERAAMQYQEDVVDSSMARFRAILPYLTPVDSTLCYLFLGNIDSVLMDTLALRQVPNTQIATFCTRPKEARFNTTPTMYDLMMQLAIQNVPLQRKITLQRQLTEWYRHKPATKENIDLLLYNELELLTHLTAQPNLLKESRRQLMQDCLNRYRSTGNEQLAQLYYGLASYCEADSAYLAAIAYCDSATARWPKSQGGIDCANLKREILKLSIGVEIQDVSPAARDILMTVKTRNIKSLHYRVIAFPTRYKKHDLYAEEIRAKLMKEKVLESWDQTLPDVEEDHKYYHHYGYIPQLAPGHYLLIASPTPDFTSQGFVVRSFTVSAAAFVLMSAVLDSIVGYVVDYISGKPIARQKVLLQKLKGDYGDKYTTVSTVTTDAQGFFSFKVQKDSWYHNYHLLTQYKGLDVVSAISHYSRDKDSVRRESTVFLDRPVYRPGDTLQFMLLEGCLVNNRVGHIVGGDTLRVELRDVNYKTFDTLFGVTDSFGSLSGQFVIPTNALPGWFTLVAYPTHSSDNAKRQRLVQRRVCVEAYKQPKFIVTLKGADKKDADGNSLVPALGDSLIVEGLAASYTQVPVSGAKVVWSVTRSYMRPWWRRWYNNEAFSPTAMLASDTLTTDAEGQFRVAFVANPDSNIGLHTKPCFTYEVRVDVTDVNGETHSQSLTLPAGYENSYIDMALPEQTAELDKVDYRYCDLNSTPLKGFVNLTVERLQLPARLWLQHPQLISGVRHTLSEEEFRKRFPMTPYTVEEEEMWLWPVERKVFDTRVRCEGLTKNSIVLPRLEAGVYRFSIATDDTASTDTAVVVYIPKGSKKVFGIDLLWSDISTEEAHVGDTVVLRVGSRHKEVWVAYELESDNMTLDRRLLRLSDEITTLRIPVTETLLGGFDINLCAVKEGRDEVRHHCVTVPFEHKKLDVKIVSFRDKLTPGEKETWTITVARRNNSQFSTLNSQLLLGMYDASLDNYGHGGNRFVWFPWHNNATMIVRGVDFNYLWEYHSSNDLLVPWGKYLSYEGKSPQGWTFTALNHRRWQFYHPMGTATARGEDGMVTMHGNAVRKRTGAKMAAQEEETVFCVVEDDAVIRNEVTVLDAAYEVDGQNEPTAEEKPYIRTNLSTLAFFEPTLRTGPEGAVTYSFTAPDLLTQWNVQGLAWTQDLSTGHLHKQLVTRKELMIQPNMPRFLREGDTATLMAKVMNLTDSTLSVQVDFSFEFPSNSQFSILNSQFVSLPPHGTAPVSFLVTVPVGGTMATYKFVATAARHSDGEQGPLPLLTNRQSVTQSVSMYTNGKGVKEYTLKMPTSSTAHPVGFTVEYTANPMWLAIQSLPYMSECSNPSNIYLFNNYYVNTVGKVIADQFPELKHCADQATEEDSPLMRNVGIRQTLLEETPWLQTGVSEVERLRQIARFFDSKTLQHQSSELFAKLQNAQRVDGGWSWMPDGRYSSTYVTQYILKGLGSLSDARLTKRALDYIDRMAYKDYLEWQKYLEKHPNSQCNPISLDYLYTRSYYAGQKFNGNNKQAFDYFYGNAKKRYSSYTSLYDQALLALVFHRNGDTKLAREMVERIRQKALYSDEMGMYWRDNKAGYFWHQRPVETQALLIETFRVVTPGDTNSIGRMQQWLLKQKQTTRWSSDIATLRAIQALLPPVSGQTVKTESEDVLVVHGKKLADTLSVPIADGTAGYLRHTYRADSLTALSDGGRVSVRIDRKSSGISWGALYYQYTEQMDKVPASETGITLRREFYRINSDGSLTPLGKGEDVTVGDRLRVRLHVSCDRNLEYVELKEFRAACLEPVSTASGWVWNRGFGYYVAVNNSHNAVYIDRLEKGKYVIDADYYVTNSGGFTLAPAVLQCLYAPEFRATSPGERLTVSAE